MRPFLAFLFLAVPALAADFKLHRDLPYAEPKNERQALDVYAPAEGKDHPIVVWIHGGGWRQGDKAGVQKKPEAFVEKGFVFVSTNYRFVPDVTVKEMAGDIAKAIRWVRDHAKAYGGDPNTIFVMGHSAGAHLAALVCTDDRYLKAEGLSLSIIKGCVPVDTAAYDVAKKVEHVSSIRPGRTADAVFGDAESQKDLSPLMHVAKGKSMPPFLILHVAARPDSKEQSETFAKALQEAGVSVTVVPAEGKTHGTINSELGLPEDKATQALWKFVESAKFVRVGTDQDVMMGIELERNEKTSKIQIVYKKGVKIGSVGGPLFIMGVFYEIAKARKCEYFANLKEWENEHGDWIFIGGFTNKKDADIKQEFGDEFTYTNESGQQRGFMSVTDMASLYEKAN
jgi:acetyl esterase/lipase